MNKCIICLEDLQTMRVQALPCMHCSHRRCLDDWQQCADKPARHCPLKCHLIINSLVDEDAGDEDEDQIGGHDGDELSQLIEEAIAR